MKGVLNNEFTPYITTLEAVHLDYKVQVLDENLRKPVLVTSTSFVIYRRLKRDKVDKHDALEVKENPPKIFLSNNIDQLLNLDFFSQFREWFFRIPIPNANRTDEDEWWQ